jgi:hypothetical protein
MSRIGFGLWPVMLALFLISCGGIDSDQNRGGVFFDEPDSAYVTTDVDVMHIAGTGKAGDDGSYVAVSWRNTLTGQAGPTSGYTSYDCIPLFSVCQWHYFWSADVPLAMGVNRIYAEDGQGGRDWVEVTRVIDAVPPEVMSVSPADKTFGVELTASISVEFSEAIMPASVTATSMRVKDRLGNSVPGSYLVSDANVTFTPDAVLTNNEDYIVLITTGVTDSNGVALTADYRWEFYTGTGRPPYVKWVYPQNGDTCANRSGFVDIRFSEPIINPYTGYVSIEWPDTSVTTPTVYAESDEEATTLRLILGQLALGQTYQGTVSALVMDSGNTPMEADYPFTLTTSTVEGGTWLPVSTVDAPSARRFHSAVWTGSEMIIWGGETQSGQDNTGARYNPVTDTWAPVSMINAPSRRHSHVAVWTGTEMIVWGGDGGANNGAIYNPVTDSWRSMSSTNGPKLSRSGEAIWTGTEMIVWGGYYQDQFYNQTSLKGAAYNPSTNRWRQLSTTNAPTERTGHSLVWTGTEMIVWGGSRGSDPIETGAAYNPSTDSWRAVSEQGAPAPRSSHAAVWTGSRMLIWGGTLEEPGDLGGIYDPVTDTWEPMSFSCAPEFRYQNKAVWTGSEMITWGGRRLMKQGFLNYADIKVLGGGFYNPIAGTWREMSRTNVPAGRVEHTIIWTGTEMIVWGGYSGSIFNTDTVLNTGGRFLP